MSNTDEDFFERADEHINLSNKQIAGIAPGKVSASMLYSTARFNAWISACDFNTATEMKNSKEEICQYFVQEYEKMLKENLDDYIENFSKYMK